LRADPEREQRIRYAAELEHQSANAFVLDAAAERAEQVIGSSAATVVPSDFFDELWDAPETPAGRATAETVVRAVLFFSPTSPIAVLGFVRGKDFNVYTGHRRVEMPAVR
jgi:uncharacterized protein (DUF1778 family)